MAFEHIDWKDIGIHAAVGSAVGAVSFVIGWPLLAANAAFWIGREAWQRIQEGRPVTRLLTSDQVVLEWSVPSVLAIGVYLLLGSVA